MAIGSPYSVCGAAAAAGSATLQVTAGSLTGGTGFGTNGGDAIAVALSGNSAAALPTGVTDSQGNVYVQAVLDTARQPSLGLWVAFANAAGGPTIPLVNGTDWIKGAFGGTAGVKALLARACGGIVQASAIDQTAHSDGATGTSPTSGATGTLALPSEWAVAAITDGAAGGTPSSWTGGFVAVSTQGTGPFLTLADQIVSATTALTAGATIVSATWECALVTLKAAAAPVPYLTQQSGMF